MKSIIHTPHKILITPARAVGKIDKKVLGLISEMKQTLLAADNPKGVGLAAPQIGIPLRIFMMRPEETDPITVFINPEYSFKSPEMVTGIPGSDQRLEGCLSVPFVWGIVTRHKIVKITYLDEQDQRHTQEFSEFPSTIIQHEMDHLEGILFTKRVVEQKSKLYKPGVDDNGEEILEPLEL